MTVATFTQSNYTDPAQTGSIYPTNIDSCIQVLAKVAEQFAPHAAASPNMTVQIAPGFLFTPDRALHTQGAVQTSGTITAPVSNPRYDAIVIDATTGALSIITGTEAGSPAMPAITSGKLLIGRVLLQTSTTAITNSIIEDLRTSTSGGDGLLNYILSTANVWTASQQIGSSQSVSLSIGAAAPTTNTQYQFFIGGTCLQGQYSVGGESDIGWNFYYNSGWKYRLSDTAFRTSYNGALGYTTFEHAVSGTANAALTWVVDAAIKGAGGLQVYNNGTAPTGGDKGAGTVNIAGDYYKNGVSMTGAHRTRQVLTSTASSTYTTPTGCTKIIVKMVGGGGGSGGVTGAVSNYAASGGGSGGGYGEWTITSPAGTYSYQCGAGGTAGSAGANAGGTGSTTTFGTFSAPGGTGSGGVTAGTTATFSSPGQGSGGLISASGQDLAVQGGDGDAGVYYGSNVNNLVRAGRGGDSFFGKGVIGSGNFAGNATGSAGTSNGNEAYGSGACGAYSSNQATNRAGGTGSQGVIFVEEYY